MSKTFSTDPGVSSFNRFKLDKQFNDKEQLACLSIEGVLRNFLKICTVSLNVR